MNPAFGSIRQKTEQTTFGICLAGQQLPSDLQDAALSFLDLPELARVMTQSRGFRAAALRALQTLPVAAVTTEARTAFALRHCKRLLSIICHDPKDLMSLARANAVTLRSLRTANWDAAILRLLCPSLTELKVSSDAAIPEDDTRKLVATFPRLEVLCIGDISLPILLASRLRLRHFELGARIRPADIPLLPLQSRLETMHCSLGEDLSPVQHVELFRALAKLPRLSVLTLSGVYTKPGPAPIELKEPIVLPALRVLGLTGTPALPRFAAPHLEALLVLRVPGKLSWTEAMRCFPSIAILGADTSFETDEKAPSQGALEKLTNLAIYTEPLTSFSAFASRLPNLQSATLTCRDQPFTGLGSVLRSAPPRVSSLKISYKYTASEQEAQPDTLGDQHPTAASASEHARLELLSLDGNGAAPAAGASLEDTLRDISLPALTSLQLAEFGGACNLGALLPRYPALRTLEMTDCPNFTLSLPDGVTLAPHLKVSVDRCPLITQALAELAEHA